MQRLLSLVEVRILAQRWSLESIHIEEGFVVLRDPEREPDPAASSPAEVPFAGRGRPQRVSADSQGPYQSGFDPCRDQSAVASGLRFDLQSPPRQVSAAGVRATVSFLFITSVSKPRQRAPSRATLCEQSVESRASIASSGMPVRAARGCRPGIIPDGTAVVLRLRSWPSSGRPRASGPRTRTVRKGSRSAISPLRSSRR